DEDSAEALKTQGRKRTLVITAVRTPIPISTDSTIPIPWHLPEFSDLESPELILLKPILVQLEFFFGCVPAALSTSLQLTPPALVWSHRPTAMQQPRRELSPVPQPYPGPGNG
ncbi:hypothetical protein WG66_005576, partial [Moniliophthora roreri]